MSHTILVELLELGTMVSVLSSFFPPVRWRDPQDHMLDEHSTTELQPQSKSFIHIDYGIYGL